MMASCITGFFPLESILVVLPPVLVLAACPMLRDIYKRYGMGRAGFVVAAAALMFLLNAVGAYLILVAHNLTAGGMVLIHFASFVSVFTFWLAVYGWWRCA